MLAWNRKGLPILLLLTLLAAVMLFGCGGDGTEATTGAVDSQPAGGAESAGADRSAADGEGGAAGNGAPETDNSGNSSAAADGSGDLTETVTGWARSAADGASAGAIKRVSLTKDVFGNDEILVEVEFPSGPDVQAHKREMCAAILEAAAEDARFNSPRVSVLDAGNGTDAGTGLSTCKLDDSGQVQVKEYQ